MALIKCIECGNQISSFADSCPHCGCPASYQKKDIDNDAPDPEYNSQKMNVLKDQERWDYILGLVKQKRGQEALEEIIKITGKGRAADEIVIQMIRTKELPVELILDILPDQATQYTKKPSASIPIPPTIVPCKACGKTISAKAETCPHCGEPTGVHVCPKCGSTDVVILDAVSKTVSLALFGPLAINTVRSKYECWECHFKF